MATSVDTRSFACSTNMPVSMNWGSASKESRAPLKSCGVAVRQVQSCDPLRTFRRTKPRAKKAHIHEDPYSLVCYVTV